MYAMIRILPAFLLLPLVVFSQSILSTGGPSRSGLLVSIPNDFAQVAYFSANHELIMGYHHHRVTSRNHIFGVYAGTGLEMDNAINQDFQGGVNIDLIASYTFGSMDDVTRGQWNNDLPDRTMHTLYLRAGYDVERAYLFNAEQILSVTLVSFRDTVNHIGIVGGGYSFLKQWDRAVWSLGVSAQLNFNSNSTTGLSHRAFRQISVISWVLRSTLISSV